MILTPVTVVTLLFAIFLISNALAHGVVNNHMAPYEPVRNQGWSRRLYYKRRYYPKRKMKKRVRNRTRTYRGPDLDWPEIPPIQMIKLPLDVAPE
ncbi:hypothetical protein X975_06844, partial [Stegodyphus mimosarum]